MGSGYWSTDVYEEANRARKASGTSAFAYSDRVIASGDYKVHPTLSPKNLKVRECRDSNEHPFSTPISVWFDVTGSMLTVPQILQAKLKGLLGLLLRKGYVQDPQIMFSAIGDATCDLVPLQVGQFESDNRMDENLGHIVLEGGGGGQRTESYELAMYLMARHTITDAWEKRGQKGYMFIIGDEMAYPKVDSEQVYDLLGKKLQADIRLETIVAELKERYEVFYLLPKGASYGGDRTILGFWKKLLGENVHELDDPESVCETIALLIGLFENSIDLDRGVSDLVSIGASKRVVASVTRALSTYSTKAVPSKTGPVTLKGTLPPATGPILTGKKL